MPCGKYRQTIFVWTSQALSRLQPKMHKFGRNLKRSPRIQLVTENRNLPSQVGQVTPYPPCN